MRIATIGALGLAALSLGACATDQQLAANLSQAGRARQPFAGVTMAAPSASGIGVGPLNCQAPITHPSVRSCFGPISSPIRYSQ